MKLQLWKCIKVAMHSALSSTTVKRQSLCSKIIIASTVRCLITMNWESWAWFNFFDPALAPLLCRLMEMNDRDFIFPQCTIVSLDMARLLCSSGLWAGSWSRPINTKWQTAFLCMLLGSEKSVCCLDESSFSIDNLVSNISERNSVSSVCRQQLITAHSVSEPSHL